MAVISIAIVVPIGFATKFYTGPFDEWFNNSVGGAIYIVFWCLVAALVWPRRPAVVPIVVAVLLITCGLEVMQLWKPPLLQSIRGHFIGRTILGTTFAASDFIYYFAGAILAWIWLRLIAARGDSSIAVEQQ